MWIFTKQGFYSAVQHRDDPERIIIRARAKKDIEALKAQIPNLITFTDKTADYPHRAIVSRDEWLIALARLGAEIDYPNFKSAIADNKRHNTYLSVWSKLLEIETEDGGTNHWDRRTYRNGGGLLKDDHLFTKLPGETDEEFERWLAGGTTSYSGVPSKPKKKNRKKKK